MKIMKFRNYCIVVMGDTTDVLSEITFVAETKPNVLNAKGILIATFSTVINTEELTDHFKSHGRSFLLFDLNTNNSGVNIEKKEIHNGLFGFLNSLGESDLEHRTEELIRQINSTADTKNDKSSLKKQTTKKERKITEDDVAKMSVKEKRELFDELFNNIENLSENEKKILEKLAI